MPAKRRHVKLMGMDGLSAIDLITIGLYAAAISALGIWAGRGERSAEDFFLPIEPCDQDIDLAHLEARDLDIEIGLNLSEELKLQLGELWRKGEFGKRSSLTLPSKTQTHEQLNR